MVKTLGAVVAAAALLAMPARSACWTAEEAAAATVRELQTAMMVSALRCQVVKIDITADYNRFLRANKATVQQMNDRLKAHFIKAAGPVKGQGAYDAFTTSLANGHGSEATNGEICASMASLAREAALMAGSDEGLLLLAARQGLSVDVPDGVCAKAGEVIAAVAPAPAAAPVPAATVLVAETVAPPAVAGPVLLAAASPSR